MLKRFVFSFWHHYNPWLCKVSKSSHLFFYNLGQKKKKIRQDSPFLDLIELLKLYIFTIPTEISKYKGNCYHIVSLTRHLTRWFRGFFSNTCSRGHTNSLPSYEYFMYLPPKSCAHWGKRSQLVKIPPFSQRNPAQTGENVK